MPQGISQGCLGLVFGRGGSGLLWGVLAALLLTAEFAYRGKRHFTLPVQARRLFVAAAVLAGMGLLRSRSINACFSFYSALIGINGIMLSDTSAYLMRENWLLLILCVAGLFPLRNMLHLLPRPKPFGIIYLIIKTMTELLMLLWAYTELLSRYLRA